MLYKIDYLFGLVELGDFDVIFIIIVLVLGGE